MSRASLALALALVLVAPVPGAEIDSITGRHLKLENSLARLDALLDAAIRRGVAAANEGEACDRERLYREVRRSISFPFIGQLIAERLAEVEDLDARGVRLEDSIYRDLGLLDAISVHLRDLSPVMRVDEHVIGADKLGHFFVQGWKYFDIAYLDEEGIEPALDFGEYTERTYFGVYTTGIYSYADLAANFEGMRFWLRLLGADEDPIESGLFFNQPYVECARRFVLFGERFWRMRRWFQLADYVTGAWDEGVNCSGYRDTELGSLVAKRIDDEAAIAKKDYTCPIEPAECARARARYGPYAHRLLHPRCLAVREKPRPPWRFWEALLSW